MKVFAEVLGKQRLYILLLLFFFCLNLKLFTEETEIEKQEEGILKEAESEKIAFELELIKKYTNENKAGKYFTGAASKEAVLFLDGFWETVLKGGGGVEILDGAASAAAVPIVFEQKANLTLFYW